MDCAVWPVTGHAFEDILDGYFPLGESVRQMMARHGFASMWITLLHAPVMNIRGLPPTAPVPLSLPKTYSGMIDDMALVATQADDGVRLSGVGDWFWVDGREETETFPPSTRLGEPAFVRGIGVGGEAADANARATVALARRDVSRPLEAWLEEATGRLGWQASRAWGLGKPVSGIRRDTDDTPHALFGRRFEAPDRAAKASSHSSPLPANWDYLLVDLSADQPDEEALELARRL
ncbi:hypothetical protein [Mesorhizobium xinjiangense]|uniref:hypothetical protein n=1 Tax=Mesorhizobium xinjiangense TaxID=2678685 RepID=UPI0012EEACAB|nr:hypothetical protein [Mesorhizobium xinjiangense]